MTRPLETPTTAEIRERYVGESYLSAYPSQRDWKQEFRDRQEFDAWLITHDAELIAEHRERHNAELMAAARRVAAYWSAESTLAQHSPEAQP